MLLSMDGQPMLLSVRYFFSGWQVGELVGGSQREERYDVLVQR